MFDPYSVFARGTEMLGGAYPFFDLPALGRQEWEAPRGRVGAARAAQARLLRVTKRRDVPNGALPFV
jgi:hypothetical protein